MKQMKWYSSVAYKRSQSTVGSVRVGFVQNETGGGDRGEHFVLPGCIC